MGLEHMGVEYLELGPPLKHVLTHMACQMPALCWAGSAKE